MLEKTNPGFSAEPENLPSGDDKDDDNLDGKTGEGEDAEPGSIHGDQVDSMATGTFYKIRCIATSS